jgi:catechol 2,3-dioxygenase
VDLYGEPGYLIFDPEWKQVRWTEEEVEEAIIFYGSPLPDSFFSKGSPQVKASISSR